MKIQQIQVLLRISSNRRRACYNNPAHLDPSQENIQDLRCMKRFVLHFSYSDTCVPSFDLLSGHHGLVLFQSCQESSGKRSASHRKVLSFWRIRLHYCGIPHHRRGEWEVLPFRDETCCKRERDEVWVWHPIGVQRSSNRVLKVLGREQKQNTFWNYFLWGKCERGVCLGQYFWEHKRNWHSN